MGVGCGRWRRRWRLGAGALLLLLAAAARGAQGAAANRDHELPTRIGEHVINADAASYHPDAEPDAAFVDDNPGGVDAEDVARFYSSSSTGRSGGGGGSSTSSTGRRSGIQVGTNQAGGARGTGSGRGQSAIKIGATNTSLRANISLISPNRTTSLVGTKPNRTRHETTSTSTTTTTTSAPSTAARPTATTAITTTTAAPHPEDGDGDGHSDYNRRHGHFAGTFQALCGRDY